MAKYEYIGPDMIDEDGKAVPLKSYQGFTVVKGQIVDLKHCFALKADSNPNYRKVVPGKKPALPEVEDRFIEPLVIDQE